MVLVIALSGLSVRLALELRAAVAHIEAAGGVEPGTLLPTLSGVAPDGRGVEVRYGATGRSTVLYFFSPACGWCERNWENVRALHAATAERFHWVGVSAATTEDLTSFARERGLDFEIVTDVPADLLQEYRFYGTPHTLVVDAEGRVTEGWVGAYRDQTADAAEAFFGVRLPGLTTIPESQAGVR